MDDIVTYRISTRRVCRVTEHVAVAGLMTDQQLYDPAPAHQLSGMTASRMEEDLRGRVKTATESKKELVEEIERAKSLLKDVAMAESLALQWEESAVSAGLESMAAVEESQKHVAGAREAFESRARETFGEQAILSSKARDLHDRLAGVEAAREAAHSDLQKIVGDLDNRLAEAQTREARARSLCEDHQKSMAAAVAAEREELARILQQVDELEEEGQECRRFQKLLHQYGSSVDSLKADIMGLSDSILALKAKPRPPPGSPAASLTLAPGKPPGQSADVVGSLTTVDEVQGGAHRERTEAIASANPQVMDRERVGSRSRRSRRSWRTASLAPSDRYRGAGGGRSFTGGSQGGGSVLHAGQPGSRGREDNVLPIPLRKDQADIKFAPHSGFSKFNRPSAVVGPPGPSSRPAAHLDRRRTWSDRWRSDSSGLPVKSEKEMERSCRVTLEEYLGLRDLKEVAACVSELRAPEYHPRLLLLWFNAVLEAMEKENAPQALVEILLSLNGQGIFTKQQLKEGLNLILGQLEDVTVDAPKAPIQLGLCLGHFLAHGVLSLADIGASIREGGYAPGSLKEANLASKVVEASVETAGKVNGASFALGLWEASGLEGTDFWDSEKEYREFWQRFK